MLLLAPSLARLASGSGVSGHKLVAADDAAADAADETLDCADEDSPGASPRRCVWKFALFICPLWMGANASYNASLKLTSITSSTIISSTSSLWTLAFECARGTERVWGARLVGVARRAAPE